MFYNIKLMRYLKQHFPFADPTIPGAYVSGTCIFLYIYSYLFSNLSMKLFFVLVSLVLQFQLLLFLGINDFSKYSYFPRCFCGPGHQSQKYKLNVSIFFLQQWTTHSLLDAFFSIYIPKENDATSPMFNKSQNNTF